MLYKVAKLGHAVGMATKQATSSYSMSRALHTRFSRALPRHGSRSKIVARLIEMWLDGQVIVVTSTHVPGFPRNVVVSNTK